MNLSQVFLNTADRYPNDIAIYFYEEQYTFKDVAQKSIHLASWLSSEMGVKPGDRVGIYCKNRPEFITSMIAILIAGGVVVPINNFLKPVEVSYILKDCDVRVLISEKPLLENVVNKSNMSYLYSCIPYLGLYSGIYGLAFLLIIGLLGWCLDDFLKDYILVLGEVVGFWEALTMAYLYYHYKCVNDNMSDDKKQYFFFANIAWFIFFVFIATLVTVLGWVIPFYSDFDTPLLLSLLVVCFPIIVLAIFAVYRFILVIYCQLKGHSALMVIRELRCKIEELLYAD